MKPAAFTPPESAFTANKIPMTTLAHQIARRVLEGSAGPYYACGDTAHVARERVIAEAARIVGELVRQAVKEQEALKSEQVA